MSKDNNIKSNIFFHDVKSCQIFEIYECKIAQEAMVMKFTCKNFKCLSFPKCSLILIFK